jgi:hypothetical protein
MKLEKAASVGRKSEAPSAGCKTLTDAFPIIHPTTRPSKGGEWGGTPLARLRESRGWGWVFAVLELRLLE